MQIIAIIGILVKAKLVKMEGRRENTRRTHPSTSQRAFSLFHKFRFVISL